MLSTTMLSSAVSRVPAAALRPGPMTQLLAIASLWASRRRERIELADLNDHLLRDIGVSVAEARKESAKPFWRA